MFSYAKLSCLCAQSCALADTQSHEECVVFLLAYILALSRRVCIRVVLAVIIHELSSIFYFPCFVYYIYVL